MTLQRNKEFFDKFLHDFGENEVVDVVEFDMGYVPFIVERVSDGQKLYLNEDNVSYSFEPIEGYGASSNKYSWGRLFRDQRIDGDFIAVGWCKLSNLEANHKAFRK